MVRAGPGFTGPDSYCGFGAVTGGVAGGVAGVGAGVAAGGTAAGWVAGGVAGLGVVEVPEPIPPMPAGGVAGLGGAGGVSLWLMNSTSKINIDLAGMLPCGWGP